MCVVVLGIMLTVEEVDGVIMLDEADNAEGLAKLDPNEVGLDKLRDWSVILK